MINYQDLLEKIKPPYDGLIGSTICEIPIKDNDYIPRCRFTENYVFGYDIPLQFKVTTGVLVVPRIGPRTLYFILKEFDENAKHAIAILDDIMFCVNFAGIDKFISLNCYLKNPKKYGNILDKYYESSFTKTQNYYQRTNHAKSKDS